MTWGSACHGGDTQSLQLKGVDVIYTTAHAFVAKLDDRSVVAWGDMRRGGGYGAHVQEQLKKGVDTIYSTWRAFAAKLVDGNVVTWGEVDNGGDCSYVQAQLKGVDTIYSNTYAFAAKLVDAGLVTWGWQCYGGDSSAIKKRSTNKRGADTSSNKPMKKSKEVETRMESF